MELFRLLAASLLLLSVNGVSNGNLPICSVDMAIGAGTNVMKWVQPPVVNTKYTISTTVGTTSYRPGALTPISISVSDIDLVYIGILLVAEVSDANGTRTNTGHWTVLDGDDFFLPAACQFKAVVHKSAELKRYNHTFFWKGDVGTGTVKFRALIKQGEQNHGNFYRPIDLQLTEGTAVGAQTVFKSSPGASCDETCGQQNKACDYAGTLNLKSRETLQAATQDFYACRQPFLKNCGPPATGANSYCYYYQCDATQTFTPIATCSRRVGDAKMDQQFCVCKAGTAVRDPQPDLYAVNQGIGFRLAAPLQLNEELTINSLDMVDDTVTVDISGPQDKWFAIGWDALSMNGAYATVVWLNNPVVKPPQRYETFQDYGYNNDKQGWYDVNCQQALNDYCRDIGNSNAPEFSCSVAGSTNQWSPKGTYGYTASRVPCRGGKPAPYQPMTVAEYKLSANPRGFTELPSTITPIRSSVDSGFFRIVFSRSISGGNESVTPFPYKKSMNLIWSLGRQQYFGPPTGSKEPLKHMKKSETQVILNLVPIYPVCALSASSTTLPSMLLLGGLVALGSKNWVLGALLAVLLPHVSAHNWVNTPSRAQIAAVTVPCQERINPAPHLQVGPGQKFQLEWSTGHGDTPTAYAYWVLLREEAYNYLVDVTDSSLDDYLNKAPAANLLIGDQWTRRHVADAKNELSTAPAGQNQGGGGLFAKTLTKDDPRYVERNPVAVAKSLQRNTDVKQYWYVSTETAGDKRAAYKSEKYPWILSVHKFKIPTHWPDELDMATFEFPNVAEPGNYIAHFKWGGYRDCTDVNIVSFSPVENPWGQIAGTNLSATFARLDHCEFTFVVNPSTQCRVMADTSAKQCLADCLKQDATWGCTSVQAVLKKNPAGTLPYTPNYPYKKYTRIQSAFDVFPPLELGACDSRTIHKRRDCGEIEPLCGDDKIGAGTDDSYICYGLQPYRDQDFQTVEDYVITTDPKDPGFYSTCWVRLAPGGFLPYPPPTKPPVVWQTGDKCLSCDWLSSTYQNLPNDAAPPWVQGLTTECSHCETKKATGCGADITFIESGNPGTCGDSIDNANDCSVSCDSGFNLFGGSRKCENGILTGPQQKCVFAGC